MNENSMTSENILAQLPAVLSRSKRLNDLAVAVAHALEDGTQMIDLARIYTNIDALPEALLDILAYDFKVDWYEYDAPVETKRAQLKNNFNAHRHLGTKGAVLDEISVFYPGADVQEWFEYDGEPYHFKVIIPLSDAGQNDETSATNLYQKIWERVLYSKSFRSVLDVIDYYDECDDAMAHAGAEVIGYAIVEHCDVML